VTAGNPLCAHVDRDLAIRAHAGSFAYTALALIVLLLTDYATHHTWLALVLLAVSTILGVGQLLLSTRHAHMQARAPRRWRASFAAVCLGFALIWSSFSATSLLLFGATWTGLLVALICAGISAGAWTGLIPDLRLNATFVIVMALPQLVACALLGGRQGIGLGLCILVYTVFLVARARHENAAYMQALQNTLLLEQRALELERARRDADAASRAKSLFLANMSHELRTPMSGVLGMAALALRTELTERQRGYLESIHRSGRSLLVLLDELLDLSRVEAGQLELRRAPFRLVDSLQLAIELLEPLAAEKGVRLSFTFDEKLPPQVVGDAARVRQVVVNLLANAVKFTEEGAVSLTARRLGSGDGSVGVEILVEDSGPGIPAHDLERIFERFVQVGDGDTRPARGAGLGLAIVREVIELMGGSVRAESEPGRGARFTVHLDLDEVPALPGTAGAADEGDASPDAVGAALDIAGTRILLVEDNPTNREIIGEVLEDAGITCAMATTGEEASQLFDAQRFDAVLLDLSLPDTDGYSVAARLRAAERAEGRTATPIIAVTAHAMKGERERCLEAGMNGYLTKPIDIDLFYRTIDEAVGQAITSAKTEAETSRG
jgi:signal transduction histidine kinase/CheY-like chemotaxis protein